jgi:hypothetical protein
MAPHRPVAVSSIAFSWVEYLAREGKPVPHAWENGPVNITPNAAGQYGLCSSGQRLRPI